MITQTPHSTATPRSGYTLLELMIAVGLSAILMASLYKAMDIYLSLQLDSHEEISRQQVARAVLRQLTRDIQSVVFTKQEAGRACRASVRAACPCASRAPERPISEVGVSARRTRQG